MTVKISSITFASCVAMTALVSGCANYRNSGAAPGTVTGTAQSEPKNDRRNQGEFYNTETLTPGIGSALFPDPAWP